MKVAVVGGGPAGLTAAKTAADNGLDVTLFEYYRVGERINCGEGFFDILGLCKKPGAGILFKVRQILLKVNKLYRIDSTKLNLWMIDRASWQRHLAEEARTSGVKILEETPVKTQDMKLLQQDFDWVIDASGVSAISLKAENNTGENRNRAALTVQCRLEGDFSSFKNSLKAVLEPHYQGYYWIFPKIASKRGIANVGIGFFNPPSARINLKQELYRVLQQENLQNYPILEYRGGKIPLNRVSPFMRGNTLLVGDAAGLASILYGGGLDMAVVSGRLAALSLAQGESYRYEQFFWEKDKHKATNEEKISNLWKQQGINFMENILRTPASFLVPSLLNLVLV